jgi:hypothetical protein
MVKFQVTPGGGPDAATTRQQLAKTEKQERIELLQRVADGVTQEEAAAAVGCLRKAVQRLLIATGGLRLRMPVRSPLRLAVAEREEALPRDCRR